MSERTWAVTKYTEMGRTVVVRHLTREEAMERADRLGRLMFGLSVAAYVAERIVQDVARQRQAS